MEPNRPRLGANLDIRSIIVGSLLALCLVLVLGADVANAPKNEPGRYQCSAVDSAAFILDTQTGQLWQVSATDNRDLGTAWERKSVRKSIIPTVD